MEILISIIMGTRLLTLFGGGLGHDAASVSFLPPRILIAHEEVRLSCSLINAYPEELKNLAKTATPVVIYLFVELKESEKSQPVKKVTIESRLQYDLIAKVYSVIRSTGPDTVRSASLDSAIRYSCTFENIPIVRRDEIASNTDYSLSSYAVLGKTKIEALHDKEVDLMYYWDFKRPNFKTESIHGEEFFNVGKK